MANQKQSVQRESKAGTDRPQETSPSGTSGADRHAALRGKSFDEQSALLSPDAAPVQLKQDGAVQMERPAAIQMEEPAAAGQAAAAPADGFSDLYRNKTGKMAGKVTVDPGRGVDYDTYKAGIGPIKASSETTDKLLPYQQKGAAAQQMTVELSEGDLLEIFNADYGKNSHKSSDDDNKHIAELLPKVNAAFRIMKLDTIGAKAAYLANAYWESAKFKYMTETEGSKKGPGWQADPHQAGLNKTWLDSAAAGKEKVGEMKVGGYQQGGTINKTGKWEDAFIGRGPLQTTHDYGYAQTLAVLEKRWEELKDAPEGSPEAGDRDLCKKALDAIKKDPSQAANPEYAFLFAAAYMKRPTGNDLKSNPGDQLASGGSATGFMGPQPKERKAEKNAVYQKAIEVLTLRQKSWDIAHEDSDTIE